MQVAIVKPDSHVQGGFERVLRHVADGLTSRGDTVDWVYVDVPGAIRTPFDVALPPDVRDRYPYYFTYMALLEDFQRLDLTRYDLVISSQPPSFAIRHPRHLALFSHHERCYYDLADLYTEAGIFDADLHREAVGIVREVDAPHMKAVTYFLAASDEVRCRLNRFNGLSENVDVYLAGIGGPDDPIGEEPSGRFDHVVCVSRQEFAKRTELFLLAMHRLSGVSAIAAGDGSRLTYLRRLEAWLADPGTDLEAVDEQSTWMNPGQGGLAPAVRPMNSTVGIPGAVSEMDLQRLYRDALCVVAPAYMEDYGLTAIEAMAHGKPLIVCADGGNLPHLVEDGVSGFVVDPTGVAIAAAVQRLRGDLALARAMGERARERAAAYTWPQAMQQIEAGIAVVMS
jgi:glycosyltransferase involved in cell wall biosynthesis